VRSPPLHLPARDCQLFCVRQEERTQCVAIRTVWANTDTAQSVAQGEALLAYMTAFPDAQKKAQAELDAVVGRDRLANLDDRPRLPYLEALMKETHRFCPITPLVPHASLSDDEYRGYRIPKGSWIMANMW
jgi:cytochrome P450